jgi:hypothetical protein
MLSKRLRSLLLIALLATLVAGCNALRLRPGDRLGACDPADSQHNAPGVARLDTLGTPAAGSPSGAEPRASSNATPPRDSAAKPVGSSTAEPSPEARVPDELPPDPRIAARALLDDLGARISADESGEIVSIDLAETGVTDADLQQVAVFSRVRELNLRGTVVSDAGLEALRGLAQIEFLGLTGTQVTDAGLPQLDRLDRLRFLTLGRTAVSDAGVSTIGEWKQLEGLNVKATRVTDNGAARLQRKLPKCRVIVDAPATDGRNSAPELRPMPERQGQLETLPGSGGTTPRPGKSGDGTQEQGRFDFEEDLSRSNTTPPGAAAQLDPRERLMLILREKLEDPAVLRAIAEVQLSQQQPQEARRLLAAAVDRAPEDRDLRYVLAVTHARCDDFDAAYREFVPAVGEAAAHYNLGVLLHEAGEHELSIREFQRALRCDPGLASAREWLVALTRPAAVTDGTVSHLLSDDEIRSLILQWTDRSTPRLGETPVVRPVAPSAPGAAPALPAATPIVRTNAPIVQPEVYPALRALGETSDPAP